jgi:hypothetical protein
LDTGRHEGVAGGFLPHVAGQARDPVDAELLDERGERRLAQVTGDHPRTGGQGQPGGGPADATACAGDDDDRVDEAA